MPVHRRLIKLSTVAVLCAWSVLTFHPAPRLVPLVLLTVAIACVLGTKAKER